MSISRTKIVMKWKKISCAKLLYCAGSGLACVAVPSHVSVDQEVATTAHRGLPTPSSVFRC